MENHKLQPLSELEKTLAEDNHNLVYGFLRQHKYSIEEYYNVVIFGYLKAIQAYCRIEEKRNKYELSVLAWLYMRAEMSNHFRTENSQCRKSENGTVSLDANYSETENFYNTIGEKSAEADIMESLELTCLLSELSDAQQKITQLLMDGYKNKEIYLMLNIKPSTYYKEVQRIKSIIAELLIDDR